MELDDLRRHWRQAEPAAPPTLTGHDLDALAKSRTLGPVARMRRSAWLEAAFTLLLCLGIAVALVRLHDGFALVYCGVLLALSLVCLVVYRQLLRVLRRMDEPAGSVRGHLAALAQGMRHLLRFYYRLTLAASPLTAGLLYGFMLWKMARRGELSHWPKTGVILLVFMLVGIFSQVVVVRFTRWYLQRLYGRHLDRLEGQLRELEEGNPAAG